MVSYAEQGSDDDEDDEEDEEDSDPEDPPSDPEDTSYGGRGGTRKRERERSGHTLHNGYDTQAGAKQSRLKKRRDELDRGWTWLGDRCPGERVRSQRVPMTKHHYLYVTLPARILRDDEREEKEDRALADLTPRPAEILEAEANKREVLVPITIDFDVPSTNPELGGIKIKDRFLWNLNGRSSSKDIRI